MKSALTEAFGSDPGDKAIRELADQIGGRVVASDRGRDIGGGFGQSVIHVPNRVRTIESAVRLVEEAIR